MRPSARSILPAACLVGLLLLTGRAVAVDATRMTFAELYASVGILGMKLSDRIQGLAGKPVAMRGYMAPPLKPEADFFVLTKEPVSLCPFCQSDADWPADIVVVYLRKGTALTSCMEPIEVSGTLEVGFKTDPRTGFVSLLRIVDAGLRRL